MSLTYLKGSRTKTKNNLLLVLEQGQAITDDGAKSTQLSMVITTLATAAKRFDAALEKLSLAIDEMDDSARQAEELELEANLSLLAEAEQLLAKWKDVPRNCRSPYTLDLEKKLTCACIGLLGGRGL